MLKITSNSSSKTHGAAAPHTQITWASLLGSEEPSLKLLHSGKLQRTNSSPISNCRHSKSAIVISAAPPNNHFKVLEWAEQGTLCIVRECLHGVIITDPDNSNKMADAIESENKSHL